MPIATSKTCFGVSGLSALGTSACARMSTRPKHAAFVTNVPGSILSH